MRKLLCLGFISLLFAMSVSGQVSKPITADTSKYWLIENIKNIDKTFDKKEQPLYTQRFPICIDHTKVKTQKNYTYHKNQERGRQWSYKNSKLDYTISMFNKKVLASNFCYQIPFGFMLRLQASLSFRHGGHERLSSGLTHSLGEHWEYGLKFEHEHFKHRDYLFDNGIRALTTPHFTMEDRLFVALTFKP